ncbi:hypothetical protein LINPERHAP1_LOCUS6246 [Linum perenne]
MQQARIQLEPRRVLMERVANIIAKLSSMPPEPPRIWVVYSFDVRIGEIREWTVGSSNGWIKCRR